MINPIHHAGDAAAVAVYKVEPYVLAADVYAVAPHVGRGGWTWYTGSAGWMYRLLTESLLGLQRHGDRLVFAPCLPPQWPQYTLRYRFGSSLYIIQVAQVGTGPARLTLDGAARAELHVPLVDDGGVHQVHLAWPGPPPA